MAHEIETIAWAGETPWHGLGKHVHNDLTPAQMQKEAGVDWKVKQVPLYFEWDGKRKKSTQTALVRETDGKVLTYVSDGWYPVQNDEAFQFFHDFVMAGDMEMHTAGSLSGGQRVWALAKLKKQFKLFRKDLVESYLLFTNPHKWGQAVDIRLTPIRVVCNNTLTLALDGKSDKVVRLGHSSKFNPELVKQTLLAADEQMEKYKEAAEELGKKKFDIADVKSYFNEIFPSKSPDKESRATKISKAAERALSIMDSQPGAELGAGTWWQPFNAVTFMVDHELGRGTDSRLSNSWYGLNRGLKTKALNRALDYANAA